MPRLFCTQVTLVPLTLQQLDDVIALVAQPSINAIMYTLPHPFRGDAAAAWLTDSNKRHYGIYTEASNRLMGCISLVDINLDEQTAEVSGFISETMRGHGLATAALAKLLDILRRDAGLRRIYAYHLRSNKASGTLLEHHGFERVWERNIASESGERPQYLRLLTLEI